MRTNNTRIHYLLNTPLLQTHVHGTASEAFKNLGRFVKNRCDYDVSRIKVVETAILCTLIDKKQSCIFISQKINLITSSK